MIYILILILFSSLCQSQEESIAATRPTIIDSISNLPTSTEEIEQKFLNDAASANVCELTLAWGHSDNPHSYLTNNNLVGTGMGCNINQKAGVKISPQYWRLQVGLNGDYSRGGDSSRQNSGLNPVKFTGNETSIPSVINAYNAVMREEFKPIIKNHHVGFMRLVQYQWLKLFQYAEDSQMLQRCPMVQIKFKCVNRDLNNKIYQMRREAYTTTYPSHFKSKDLNEDYREELRVLNSFQPLKGCGLTENIESTPKSCDQVYSFNKKNALTPQCKQWLNYIDKLVPEKAMKTDKVIKIDYGKKLINH